MSWLGPHAFFGYIGIVAGLLTGFALYRMGRRKALPVEEQREFVPMPRMSPVGAALHPDAKARNQGYEARVAETAD